MQIWDDAIPIVSMGSHAISIQRRSGHGFVDIAGQAIKPDEAIRIISTGGGIAALPGARLRFTLADEVDGKVLLDREVRTGLQLSAYLDFTAPPIEGYYRVDISMSNVLPGTGQHIATAVFQVNQDAPSPPAPLPGRGNLGDLLGDAKNLGIIAIVILGILTIRQVIRP